MTPLLVLMFIVALVATVAILGWRLGWWTAGGGAGAKKVAGWIPKILLTVVAAFVVLVAVSMLNQTFAKLHSLLAHSGQLLQPAPSTARYSSTPFSPRERQQLLTQWLAAPLSRPNTWRESAERTDPAAGSLDLREARERFLLNFGYAEKYHARITRGVTMFSTMRFTTAVGEDLQYLRPEMIQPLTEANVGWIVPIDNWQRDTRDPKAGYYFELHKPDPDYTLVLHTERIVPEGTWAEWGPLFTKAPDGRPLAVEIQLVLIGVDAAGELYRLPPDTWGTRYALFCITDATAIERIPAKDMLPIAEEVTVLPEEFLRAAGHEKRLLLKTKPGSGRVCMFVNVRIKARFQ